MALVSAVDATEAGAGGGARRGAALLVGGLVTIGALVALDLSFDAARIVKALGDTDDATRLVQVRELLAGAPLQDTTLPRFGAPQPLVSHWSRLIDVPLAVLMAVSAPLLGWDGAELVVRYVWPLLLLLPLVMMLAHEAQARAGGQASDDAVSSGRAAAYVAMALAVTSFSGLHQFMPGRIDHHGGMIVCAVAGFIYLGRSFADARSGVIAGALLALGTAIGYEALALTVGGFVAQAVFVLASGRGGKGLVAAAATLAAGLLVALVLTTAPARLLTSHCDALSLNLVLLAAASAAGLWLVIAGPAARLTLAGRLGVLALVGAAGLAAYVGAEPQCLKGPFGELDPAIGPLWLVDVMETKPISWMLHTAPAVAIAFVFTAALGLASAWRLWRSDKDDRALLALLVLALAVLLAGWQMKLVPYATFLAVVPTAALIGRLPAMRGLSRGVVRGLAGVGASQLFLIVVATPIGAVAVKVDTEAVAWMERARTCIASRTVAPMAALPPGLVFSDRDLAPFIVALTQNRVVAAPYHRLDKAIVATHAIFFGPEDEALHKLTALGVTYVAVCDGLTPPFDPANRGRGLLGALSQGRVPGYLEPVALSGETPLRVWRLRPAG